MLFSSSTLTRPSASSSLVISGLTFSNASISPSCPIKDSSPPSRRPRTASGALSAADKPSRPLRVPTPRDTPTFPSEALPSRSRAWSATDASTKPHSSPSPRTPLRSSQTVTVPCPSSRSQTTWAQNSRGSWRARRRRRTRPCWRSWRPRRTSSRRRLGRASVSTARLPDTSRTTASSPGGSRRLVLTGSRSCLSTLCA
ncbi:uncharacterized protein J3D65DRAFT_450983 [Phyllosticta citribraziliensis]|uniref:Uncharacterized protein n=1 Tax=Phyllosticta citribraziliensis TaxID=989973 RepID=A0ABR1LKZ8_9PEZI